MTPRRFRFVFLPILVGLVVFGAPSGAFASYQILNYTFTGIDQTSTSGLTLKNFLPQKYLDGLASDVYYNSYAGAGCIGGHCGYPYSCASGGACGGNGPNGDFACKVDNENAFFEAGAQCQTNEQDGLYFANGYPGQLMGWDNNNAGGTAQRACQVFAAVDSGGAINPANITATYTAGSDNGDDGAYRNNIGYMGSGWDVFEANHHYVKLTGDERNSGNAITALSCFSSAVPNQSLSLDKTSIAVGQSATLSWNDNDFFAGAQQTCSLTSSDPSHAPIALAPAIPVIGTIVTKTGDPNQTSTLASVPPFSGGDPRYDGLPTYQTKTTSSSGEQVQLSPSCVATSSQCVQQQCGGGNLDLNSGGHTAQTAAADLALINGNCRCLQYEYDYNCAVAPAATSTPVSPSTAGTYTYTYSCTNAAGTTNKTALLTVTPSTPASTPVITSCSASPNPANTGQTVTWSYTATGGMQPITATAWTGAVTSSQANPTASYASPGSQTAQLVVTDSAGTKSAQATCAVLNVTSPLPDLTASDITPTSATAGTAVTLSSTISNTGQTSTGRGFTTLFQTATDVSGSNPTTLGTYSDSTLAAAGNAPAQFPYTFTTAGTYYVRACADKASASDTGVISESNENNNCSPDWVKVTVAAGGPVCVPTQGSACTSATNSCGMTNAGIIQCDGSCSALPPPNTSCGGGASVSCSRSPSGTTLTVPATVQFTATPQGGALAPFTFTDALGNTLQSGVPRTFSKTYTSAGTYAVQVAASNATGPYACGTSFTVGSAIVPTAYITAAPLRVASGDPTGTNISWSATSVTACTVSGSDGYAPNPQTADVNGTVATTTVNRVITTQTKYTIDCTTAGADAIDSVIVNTLPAFNEF